MPGYIIEAGFVVHPLDVVKWYMIEIDTDFLRTVNPNNVRYIIYLWWLKIGELKKNYRNDRKPININPSKACSYIFNSLRPSDAYMRP